MSTYVGPLYEPTPEVIHLHATPRFGYPSDWSLLFSSNSNEQLSYTYGAIFISVVIYAVFIGWLFVLALFKCLGQRQVGFFSGSKFVEPLRGVYRRPRRVRITVIIACAAIIIFNVLLVTRGVNNIYVYTSDIKDSTEQVKSIVDDAATVSAEIADTTTQTIALREQLIANDFENVCSGVSQLDSQSILSALSQIDDYTSDVNEMARMSSKLQVSLDNFNSVLENYVKWEWWQAMPMIGFMVCAAIFIVGSSLAWAEVSTVALECIQTWLVLPIFTLLTFASWIIAGAFALGMVSNADMCSGGAAPGSPDATLISTMDRLEMDPDSLVYETVDYIVGGCRAETPFFFVKDYNDNLDSIADATGQYLTTWNSLGDDFLQANCGGDITNVEGNLEVLSANINNLAQNTLDIISLSNCKRTNQIYVNAVHDATCDYSVNALLWIFSSLMVLAVCGMVVITLRSAWLGIRRPTLSDPDPNQVITPEQKGVEMVPVTRNSLSTQNTEEPPLGMIPQSSTETWERLPPAVTVGDVPPLLQGMSSVHVD